MNKTKLWLSGLLPIVLLIILVFIFVNYGPLGVFKADLPPIENIFIERFVLEPDTIFIHVINDGPEPVTIAQLTVNEVFWHFEMQPSNTLQPLEKGTLRPCRS